MSIIFTRIFITIFMEIIMYILYYIAVIVIVGYSIKVVRLVSESSPSVAVCCG